MKVFLVKLSISILVFLTCTELLSRLVIDPFYFYSIDTFNMKSKRKLLNIYHQKRTAHVDYLFIGNSRVPATINPELIMRKDTGKTVIVAGRGYLTPGIHYQALKSRIAEFPDYLKNANVFIEYPGSCVYTNHFSDDKLFVFEMSAGNEKPMPHLLLPHLNPKTLFTFLRESNNSLSVKLEMLALYTFSTYRTHKYIKEKFKRLNTPLIIEAQKEIIAEAGIRNDVMDYAKQMAVMDAQREISKLEKSPLLNNYHLNQSTLASFHDLIVNNGGSLFLYKMPLHSVLAKVHQSEKAMQNRKIFEDWATTRGITIIYNEQFEYSDNDFPDTWHLCLNKRDNFTELLYENFKEILIDTSMNNFAGK